MRYIFTDREGGVSAPPFSSFNLGGHVGDDPVAVQANRARLALDGGLTPTQVVWMGQIHSATVVAVDGPRPAGVRDADGLVTGTPGLALAVLVADCVPVLAYDESARVIGAAHAGRSGAAGGVGRELIRAMIALGAAAPNIQVILGPAVCGQCYEVPPEMRAAVAAQLPGSATTSSTGTPALDLRAGLRQQLHTLGVRGVAVDPRCTMEEPGLFSHRRGAPTGRQAGVIWLTGDS